MLNHFPHRPTNILLVDDHPIIRFGFATLLAQFDATFVFHETESAKGALELAELHSPKLALLDLSLAGTLSLDLIKRLRRVAPGMAILVVSMHDERAYAERVLRAGARGYVMKQLAAKTITIAVERVLAGKIWLSEDIRDDLVDRIARTDAASNPDALHSLSDRELTVLRLIGAGMKKGDIARELSLSPNTVETYRAHIKQKLGLVSGAELYRYAFLHAQDEPSLLVEK